MTLSSPFVPSLPSVGSAERTGLKLCNLESEIRAGGGYYLRVDSD